MIQRRIKPQYHVLPRASKQTTVTEGVITLEDNIKASCRIRINSYTRILVSLSPRPFVFPDYTRNSHVFRRKFNYMLRVCFAFAIKVRRDFEKGIIYERNAKSLAFRRRSAMDSEISPETSRPMETSMYLTIASMYVTFKASLRKRNELPVRRLFLTSFHGTPRSQRVAKVDDQILENVKEGNLGNFYSPTAREKLGIDVQLPLSAR